MNRHPLATPSPEAIARIHDSGKQGVIAVTGGGSAAIAALLAVPGASRFLLEARIPYCTAALDEYLGAKPEQYCSDRTARAIAMAAFWRARKLAGPADIDHASQLIGLGATASLASDRPKRGRHRLHAALQTAKYTAGVSLTLMSGRRNRFEEETLAGDLLIAFLSDATSNALDQTQSTIDKTNLADSPESDRFPISFDACPALTRFRDCLPTDELLDGHIVGAPPDWTQLLLGKTGCVACEPLADSLPPCEANVGETKRVLFPGAFNPLHDGHRAMARFAAEHLGRAVEYELSIENVDKPPLDFLEIARRAQPFAQTGRLWLTRAPTFLAKARLFPNCVFLVGADTVIRIAIAKYYPDTAARDAAIDEIRQLGCRFLVFGRVAQGRFQSLEELALPPALRALCDAVPESGFRADISSSEIRRRIEQSANRAATEEGDLP
jgi:hypothetical protein